MMRVFEQPWHTVEYDDRQTCGGQSAFNSGYRKEARLSGELGVNKQPRVLLVAVRDLELVEMDAAERRCGFGWTFAVKIPKISTAKGGISCASVLDTGAEYVVSNNSSCPM